MKARITDIFFMTAIYLMFTGVQVAIFTFDTIESIKESVKQ